MNSRSSSLSLWASKDEVGSANNWDDRDLGRILFKADTNDWVVCLATWFISDSRLGEILSLDKRL
jgi:hypothetical protein